MPSLKSRLFIGLMKYRNRKRFKLGKRPVVNWDTSIPELRKQADNPPKFMAKLPRGVTFKPADIGSVYAEWITIDAEDRTRAILYFHGGGYVIGSVKGHRPHVSKFVHGSGVNALLFDYRLGPENPFPAGLEDALHAYKWLLTHGYGSRNIVFAGDSAGGGLCLATLLAAKDRGLPMPGGAVTLSAWTDLTCSGETLTSNESVDPLTWRDSWEVFSRYYLGDHDPRDPYASPLFGDLTGLPSLLMYAGGDELLLSDTTRFAEAAARAGVKVTLKVGEGMFHCYPVLGKLFPESAVAMQEVCAFIESHTR